MAIKGGSTHYKSGKVEPLELTEAQNLSFHMGNVVKYAVRMEYYKDKDAEKFMQAYEKAVWYLNRYRDLHGK